MNLIDIVDNTLTSNVTNFNSSSIINANIEKSGTQLKDFLSKFSNEKIHVNSLNTKNTFEVTFKFLPIVTHKTQEENKGKNIAKQVKQANGDKPENPEVTVEHKSYGDTSMAAKILAGYNQQFSSTTQKPSATSEISTDNPVEKELKEYLNSQVSLDQSFIYYLIKANLLSKSSINSTLNTKADIPLELQLGYYVQNIKMPSIKMQDGGKTKVQPFFGEFPVTGLYSQPDNNKITMTILNTKLPLIERIFYPWMKEINLPFWVYNTQPYTTADIVVDFNKHTDIQYVFVGCKPSNISLITASQQNNQSFTRDVEFIFDAMIIKSKLSVKD